MDSKIKLKILLIEDNEDDIFFIKKALIDDKFDLKIIHSGDKAYQYLLKPDIFPDVVLLDKNLPGINGLELLELIKKQDFSYSVIFLTADKNIDTVIKAMKLGALDFIVKSKNMIDELPEKIEKVYNIHLSRIEKLNTEEEIREREYHFRTLFRNSPIAYLSLDEHGILINVNERFCEMIGYKPKELIGKCFGDFWTEDVQSFFSESFSEFKNRGTVKSELDIVHKHGYIITVMLEGSIQKDVQEKFIRSHFILHNITERKMMEKTLSQQYLFQRLVVDISSSLINIDKDSMTVKIYEALRRIGKYYYVDRCYISLFGQTLGNNINIAYEWCGKGTASQKERLNKIPWNKFSWLFNEMQKKQPVILKNLEDLPKQAMAEKDEFAFQSIVSLICLPMFNNDDIVGFMGLDNVNKPVNWQKREIVQLETLEKIITGVLLRKLAEEELRQSEIRYKTVSDYTYNWEYWIDPENNIKYMSPAVKRITGYKVEEFIKNPNLLNLIVYKDDITLWKKHRKSSANPDKKSDLLELEYRINSKDGKILWIGHLCRNIYEENGEYLGVRVSNQDITQRMETEKQLLNIVSEVEERERNRFAMELHDGLGPLLSNVKLFFQWLAETGDIEKAKLITQKGNQSIDLAIQTTREISYNLNPPVLNKYGFVDAIESIIQRINETSKLEIDFKYNSKERFGKIAEKSLYYITYELINNTIRHSQATKANITFNKYKDSNNNIILFLYSDNGIGFNVESAIDIRKNKGIGLWSIFQKIETLRGKVKLESNQGKGMNIYIELNL